MGFSSALSGKLDEVTRCLIFEAMNQVHLSRHYHIPVCHCVNCLGTNALGRSGTHGDRPREEQNVAGTLVWCFLFTVLCYAKPCFFLANVLVTCVLFWLSCSLICDLIALLNFIFTLEFSSYFQ